MDFLNHIAPATSSKKNTARKVPNKVPKLGAKAAKVPKKVPKPGAKAAKATSIDLQPIDNSDLELDSSQDEDVEQSMEPTGLSKSPLFHSSCHSRLWDYRSHPAKGVCQSGVAGRATDDPGRPRDGRRTQLGADGGGLAVRRYL